MPEHPICVHCRKPIHKDDDDYVVINKDQVKYDSDWKYAHLNCQKQHAK